MNESVSIIDYGVGNISSVANMLRRAGANVFLVSTPEEVVAAERLILPGVGAFDTCREALNAIPGLTESIISYADAGRPMLGICVGMQLLATSSEEGRLQGLNLIPGKVRKFFFPQRVFGKQALKVPHMGWSSIRPVGNNPLYCNNLTNLNRFYFVHSYYFDAEDTNHVAAWGHYGYEFAASVKKANIHGVQFHPEKSHNFGLQLFKNFVQTKII